MKKTLGIVTVVILITAIAAVFAMGFTTIKGEAHSVEPQYNTNRTEEFAKIERSLKKEAVRKSIELAHEEYDESTVEVENAYWICNGNDVTVYVKARIGYDTQVEVNKSGLWNKLAGNTEMVTIHNSEEHLFTMEGNVWTEYADQ